MNDTSGELQPNQDDKGITEDVEGAIDRAQREKSLKDFGDVGAKLKAALSRKKPPAAPPVTPTAT